ncbi:Uncharacterised protein [Enterobacter hormaechei]|nr:Uncharacterised protein [Enterobacter hormaechei]
MSEIAILGRGFESLLTALSVVVKLNGELGNSFAVKILDN